MIRVVGEQILTHMMRATIISLRAAGSVRAMIQIGNAIDFSREVCLSYDNYLPLEYAKHVKQK